jgi:hypothetical protein
VRQEAFAEWFNGLSAEVQHEVTAFIFEAVCKDDSETFDLARSSIHREFTLMKVPDEVKKKVLEARKDPKRYLRDIAKENGISPTLAASIVLEALDAHLKKVQAGRKMAH